MPENIFLGFTSPPDWPRSLSRPWLRWRTDGRALRRWGRVCFWATTMATFSAMAVAAHRANPSLLLIGIFSFYFAFSGYRMLSRNHTDKASRVTVLDWAVAVLTVLASLAMIMGGASNLGRGIALNPVFILLGILGSLAAVANPAFLPPLAHWSGSATIGVPALSWGFALMAGNSARAKRRCAGRRRPNWGFSLSVRLRAKPLTKKR